MNDQFGLLPGEIDLIISVLKKHPTIEQAYIFGSRAKKTFKPGSDVDLAIEGSKLNHQVLTKLSYQLNEETAMPYQFDIVDKNKITSVELVDHIERVGIPILESKKSK